MTPAARTLVDLLRQRAFRYVDKVAVSFSYNGDDENASQLTYRQLDLRARAIAAGLHSEGAAGRRVLVLCDPGLDWIAGLFGCLYAGAVAVPVHQQPAPRLAAIVADAHADFALTTADTQANTRATVEGIDGRVLRWCAVDAPESDADKWVVPDLDPGTVAMIQYTSGSTGPPKGVVLTHANLLHNVELSRQACGGDDCAVGVFGLPPHHDTGLIGAVLHMLYLGATSVLMSPTAVIERPMHWLAAVSRHRATFTGAPNFAYDRCVEESTADERAALDLSSLTTAINGAEPVRAATLAAFADAFAPAGFRLESFCPVYGLAEATLLVSGGSDSGMPGVRYVDRDALSADRVVDVAPDDPGAAPIVGCGRPRGGQDVIIVDPVTHLLCGPDEVGEIWLAGPSVAQGYWGRPEQTEQAFAGYVPETVNGPRQGPFLRSGDLGFRCADELFITGRVKGRAALPGAAAGAGRS